MADRPCDFCEKRDDGPRHVVGSTRPDGATSMACFACCAKRGCPTCSETLAARGA